jgi:hypothetical protein
LKDYRRRASSDYYSIMASELDEPPASATLLSLYEGGSRWVGRERCCYGISDIRVCGWITTTESWSLRLCLEEARLMEFLGLPALLLVVDCLDF